MTYTNQQHEAAIGRRGANRMAKGMAIIVPTACAPHRRTCLGCDLCIRRKKNLKRICFREKA